MALTWRDCAQQLIFGLGMLALIWAMLISAAPELVLDYRPPAEAGAVEPPTKSHLPPLNV